MAGEQQYENAYKIRLGQQLRVMRERSGLTQAYIAHAMAYSRTQVSRFETGRTIIGINALYSFTRIVRVSEGDLEELLELRRMALHPESGSGGQLAATVRAVYRAAVHDHRVFAEAASPVLVPISVYLGDETTHLLTEQALSHLMAAFGLEELDSAPAMRGSWFRQLFGRAKNVATSEAAKEVLQEVHQAARLQGLHLPQAEVDEKKAAAVASLIQSLAGQERAVIMVGSLLVLKSGSTVAVRDLTVQELIHMERNPSLMADPATLLAALQSMSEKHQQIEGTA